MAKTPDERTRDAAGHAVKRIKDAYDKGDAQKKAEMMEQTRKAAEDD